MTATVVLFVLVLAVACVAGFVQGTFGKGLRAGSRPADDPAGGFASPRQVRAALSPQAVRAAGTQVRPGLSADPSGPSAPSAAQAGDAR